MAHREDLEASPSRRSRSRGNVGWVGAGNKTWTLGYCTGTECIQPVHTGPELSFIVWSGPGVVKRYPQVAAAQMHAWAQIRATGVILHSQMLSVGGHG